MYLILSALNADVTVCVTRRIKPNIVFFLFFFKETMITAAKKVEAAMAVVIEPHQIIVN